MIRKMILTAAVLSTALLTGCASVKMESAENDALRKTFTQPAPDKAGLYVYRNSFVGQALKKTVTLDDVVIGETANKVYFYKQIEPGSHKLATESEFSDNMLTFEAAGGTNYFAEQYIKMGAFVGGAGLKMVSEEEGKSQVLQCKLGKEGMYSQ